MRTDILTGESQDEAYELGQQWAQIYDSNSPSRALISNLMETSCLVNVVHNNFQDPEAIFQPFFKAGAEYAAAQGTAVNGHPN
jgi:methylenetetrahydrofolate reductase (NADPH)